MNCGGKKYSPSSSPGAMISRVFQVSWFPKLKPRGSTPETSSPRTERGPMLPQVQREARLNSLDEDDEEAYWRLSFRADDKKSIAGIPVSNSDTESQTQVPSFGSREAEERQYKDRITRIHEQRRSRKVQLERGPGDDEKLKPVEKDIFPIETEVFYSRNSVDEDYSFGKVSASEWQSSDKVNEETEYRGEPTYRTSKKTRRRRMRPKSNSPKTEFRVRMLEEMKKEKIVSKKESVAEGTTVYDSFAEVKNSFDPQRDFRDSMVEMICEKGIRRREELENLLACYLTLNRDEYHDLIIKVFQQVWFDLSGY